VIFLIEVGMRFIFLWLISFNLYAVTHVNEPVADIVKGSHVYDAATDQYAKRALMSGSSIESSGNSSTTALTSGATFTGTGEINSMPQVGVMVKADNSGTLYFDFSNDGTNWDSSFPPAGFKVASGIAEFHTAVKLGRYFRVRFVNDAGAQSYFRLKTYYGSGFVPSVSPTNQPVAIDNDALVVRPTIPEDEVVIGQRSGVSHFTKFGYREGLTDANGEETVWATTGNFTPLASGEAQTFTIAYDNTDDGATASGATSLFIDYIDENGLGSEATHVLGSDGSDVTSFSGLGINRVSVASNAGTGSNGNDITFTATTAGTTQAFIPTGNSVTQQAIFFVDSNSYAVAKFLWINVNKLSGGGSPRLTVKGYAYNRNVATTYEVFRVLIDTSTDSIVTLNEPVGFRLTPTDVLYFVVDTNTNNAQIDLRFSVREYKID